MLPQWLDAMVLARLNCGLLETPKSTCMSTLPILQNLYIIRLLNSKLSRVATSLNRLIFDSPKANDALLFMTILSTDLRSLKRRGYNGKQDQTTVHSMTITNFQCALVDRILRQQKDARLAAENARAAEIAKAAKEQEVHQPLPGSFETLVEKEKAPAVYPDQPAIKERAPSPTPAANPFQNWKRKIGSLASVQSEKLSSMTNQLAAKPGVNPPVPAQNAGPSRTPLLPNRPNSNPTGAVTPLSNISMFHSHFFFFC